MVAPVTLTTDGLRICHFEWVQMVGLGICHFEWVQMDICVGLVKNVGNLVTGKLFCVLMVYFAFVSPKEKVALKIGLFAGSGWWKNEVCSNRHIFVYCGVQSVHGARVHRAGNTDSGWCEFVLLLLGFFDAILMMLLKKHTTRWCN